MAQLLHACDIEMALLGSKTRFRVQPNFKLAKSLTDQLKLLARTLAALADAHDEHMLIVRLADADTLDSVHFRQELRRLHVVA